MKYHHKAHLLLYGIFIVLPTLVFAQKKDIDDIVKGILDIIDAIIPVIFGLALLFFLWGLAKFILNAGNETARTEARSIMIWGIIALFVMVSVWGLVNLLVATFDLDSTGLTLPQLP